MATINCKGKLIDLDSPKIMGILNITPDSFFDGGKYSDEKSILEQVEKMLSEGATFIDVGAYSSRPGATHISEEEELNRIIPIIKILVAHFPEILLSVDTFRSKVAKECIEAGAAIINDISGGNADPDMFATAVELQVPYIIMHMQGTPQNMQDNPQYNNISEDLILDFSKKTSELKKMGLNDIIIDLGFGFGKTVSHNYELLRNLDLFHALECPILTGISRKSMLYKPLDISAKEALNATTYANTIALQKGSQILRVHDVKEAQEIIALNALLLNS
ncbi:dihydropteroate synthase [Flavicella sp.]|uniref:dihydropteroate synthase n=1 Tax=Flavicella sp. TaxID=2957742 RepID=UPI0026177135|nr:dihydropteroate synthase [Flavicella sp.]MDG1806193.1 dihydropteroate synthase [Flavicella sp.]